MQKISEPAYVFIDGLFLSFPKGGWGSILFLVPFKREPLIAQTIP